MSHPMIVALMLAAACAVVALGYPDGAPDDVDILRSMLPHHSPGPRRSSTSPYNLEVTETNGTLLMLIDGQFAHRGFLITVAGAEDGLLGAFQQPAPSGCRLLANGTAATHSSPENKQQTLVIWTLPANRKRSTYFIYYTVVMSFSTYWVRLNKTVTVSAAQTSAQLLTPATPATEATDNANTAVNADASAVVNTLSSTVVNTLSSTVVNTVSSTVVNIDASTAVYSDAVTARNAATAAANTTSDEPAISTEQQVCTSESPFADALSLAATPAARVAAAIASTDHASDAGVTGATMKDATTAAAKAAVDESVILTKQQLFTSGSPSSSADAHSPVGPMAMSSASAANKNTTILVASLAAADAVTGAPRTG